MQIDVIKITHLLLYRILPKCVCAHAQMLLRKMKLGIEEEFKWGCGEKQKRERSH